MHKTRDGEVAKSGFVLYCRFNRKRITIQTLEELRPWFSTCKPNK